MRVANRLLEDEALIEAIYQAQGKRYRQSRRRGRKQTPAEVVLRDPAVNLLHHLRPDQLGDPGANRRPMFRSLLAWYPASRGLVLVAMVSIAGVALGVWLFLGSLIMVLAVSLGYYGRSITLRTAER